MKIEKITHHIGARISGIDISGPLDPATVADIKSMMDEHGALFFVGQRLLSADEHLRFVRNFGDIHVSEFAMSESGRSEVLILDQDAPKGQGTDLWHSDSTYLRAPPGAGSLQAHILPEIGGDTCFASMYAAYDGLSAPMRRFLEDLTASHSAGHALSRNHAYNGFTFDPELAARSSQSHPVVAAHPVTGRRFLFVNSGWTQSIDGVSRAESDQLLSMLFDHVKNPEYQMRYRWSVGDFAFWNNHTVQHFAVPDYRSRRRMQNVRMEGAPLVPAAQACAHEAKRAPELATS